jgi:RNA polymerase sigma-70 factor (ECF subfamily)
MLVESNKLCISAAPVLRDIFVANAPRSSQPGVLAFPDLDSFLKHSIEIARSAFPEINISADSFVACWAGHLPGSAQVAEVLHRTRLPELYLTVACAHGDKRAWAILEERYFKSIDVALSRLHLPPELWDDVKQEMRRTLLIRTGPNLPKIAGYSGRGSLNAWLRTIALRFGQRQLRSELKAELSEEDELLPGSFVEKDPQLSHIRRVYLKEFKAAFAQAMVALSVQDRNLIRLYYLDGLGIEQIAKLFQLHHSSISRRLARTRNQLLTATRQQLRRELRVADCELDSIMRALGSRLSLSTIN